MAWMWTFLKVIAFAIFSLTVKMNDVWHPISELPVGCAHDALPGNHSGIKVLIIGLAKCGTRTICHALNEVGVRAYHSEDFHFLPWWDFVHDVRKEGGPHAQLPAALLAQEMLQDQALAGRLMQKISKCRMGAVALDGLEILTEPIIKHSPGAKVIVLNWRTFPEWKKSLEKFIPKLVVMCLHNLFTGASLGLLPWLALLRPLDRLLSSPVEGVLREGGPPITEVSGPLMWMYHQSLNHRRQYECWAEPTTTVYPESEDDFKSFYADTMKHFSKDDIFEWDPRKNTMTELCKFLGIEPCPKTGKVPRAINTWIFERDFPIAAQAVIVLRFFLYWVNWKLFAALLSALMRCFRKSKSE